MSRPPTPDANPAPPVHVANPAPPAPAPAPAPAHVDARRQALVVALVLGVAAAASLALVLLLKKTLLGKAVRGDYGRFQAVFWRPAQVLVDLVFLPLDGPRHCLRMIEEEEGKHAIDFDWMGRN